MPASRRTFVTAIARWASQFPKKQLNGSRRIRSPKSSVGRLPCSRGISATSPGVDVAPLSFHELAEAVVG